MESAAREGPRRSGDAYDISEGTRGSGRMGGKKTARPPGVGADLARVGDGAYGAR